MTETWPIDKLVFYARNPRKNDAVVDRMCSSIQEFGFKIPVLARSSGEVIDGHLRLKAARKMGISEVPVILCDEWTEAQVKAFRLLVNRSVAWADWDEELLRLEFADLKDLEFDLSLTGFDTREIDGFTIETNPSEDEAPPLPEMPVTKPGDLWIMGAHRVLCGDSTAAADVARLLGDRKPLLMVTDPPYGVQYDPTWRDGKGGFSTAAVVQRGRAENDDRVDWAAAFKLFPGGVAYIWHASMKTIEAGVSVESAGFEVRSVIIWRKQQQPLFGQGHYHWKHEPCWYAVRKGGTANWVGDRKQSTVWDVANLNPTGNRTEERTGHGTQKPVELMRRPMLNHTAAGDHVYDPFLGSGSTLIAAETTGRACFGLEIDPAYCDVIVQRWEKLTGKTATLENIYRA